MRHIIENNGSKTITVVTDSNRLSIKQEFKGSLSPSINRYKVMILNKDEVRRLLPIAKAWLNGGLK